MMNKEKIFVSLISIISLALSLAVFANDDDTNAKPQSTATVESKTQSEQASGIGLDFHLGPTLATFGGDVGGSNLLSSKFGFSAGVGYDIPLSDILYLHPELNYAQKGVSITVSGISVSANLNYLELPLLLKGQIPMPSGSVRPYLVAGPAIGFAVSKSANVNITNNGNTLSLSKDIGSGFKSLDYGIQFGAGVDIPVSDTNSMLVDFRYDLGLANLNGTDSGESIKNRTMTLALGYKL